jgi:hypothetical protein
VVEQRYLAVREALDGAKITDVAARYGVGRRTGQPGPCGPVEPSSTSREVSP